MRLLFSAVFVSLIIMACCHEDPKQPYDIVIKLEKRNDEMAKKIANEHGLAVKGEAFMDSYYHLAFDDSQLSAEQKQAVYARLTDNPDVEEVTKSFAHKRAKRGHNADEL
ncbi:hypothetical protein QR680_008851 [Steinernema hermaphroditum]|uniref:Peptidase S8 pro-domain domain-containing protein n=1 Tax=Steinernema hermaphroditum TaxID=289476 RepID=A0AA39IJM8_9BILA|nr:hypothetical protein QR680_008851 [Steinernema hermaphroditum]